MSTASEAGSATPSELFACAGTLVDLGLVDVGAQALPPAAALTRALRTTVTLDDQVAQRAAGAAIQRHEDGWALFRTLDTLIEAMFEMRSGLPALRPGTVPVRLAYLIDPDALVALHPELELPVTEDFDWPTVPGLADSVAAATVLAERSAETHIHLGGALAPLYYWMPLVSGHMSFASLRSQVCPEIRSTGQERSLAPQKASSEEIQDASVPVRGVTRTNPKSSSDPLTPLVLQPPLLGRSGRDRSRCPRQVGLRTESRWVSAPVMTPSGLESPATSPPRPQQMQFHGLPRQRQSHLQ